MKLMWKSVTAVLIAASSLTMAAAPAQAHDSDYRWRGNGGYDRYYDGRWDRRDRRDWRRNHWRDDRRHWRGDRAYWRGDRRRCWNEWRYDRWRDRDVKVRICR